MCSFHMCPRSYNGLTNSSQHWYCILPVKHTMYTRYLLWNFYETNSKILTDLSVIVIPIGDDLFIPLSTGAIHPFPSLIASASWKADYMHTTWLRKDIGMEYYAKFFPWKCVKDKNNAYKGLYNLCQMVLGKAFINYWLPENHQTLLLAVHPEADYV